MHFDQGYKTCCLEEIAWNNAWMTKEQILQSAGNYSKNSYGQYLVSLIK